MDGYTWNSSSCLEEFNTFTDNDQINYSELARKHQLQNKNGKSNQWVRVTKSNQPKKYNQHVLGSRKEKNYVNLQNFGHFRNF